jgi:gas vesicle protein
MFFYATSEPLPPWYSKLIKITRKGGRLMAETFRIEIPISVEDNTDPGVSQATRKINGFDRANQKTQERLNQMNRTRYQVVLDALDRASGVIGKVSAKARSIAGKTYSFTMKVIDLVTKPFRSILSGLNSILGLVGAGISIAGGIILPLQLTIQQQNIETAFEVLLGSAEAAKKRVDELTTFAGQTPFTRDEIYETSRVLQVFTGDALSTGEGLRMIGDIAAGTRQQFGDVALWMGRLYDAMAAGRPVGEMTSRLQEMGAISGAARDRLEKLAASGLDISKTWPKATEEFVRFDGMMEKLSGNLANLLLGVKSFFTNNILKRWGAGITAAITPPLEAFRRFRKENGEGIARMGDLIEQTAARSTQYLVDKAQIAIRRIQTLFDDNNFKNADLMGKLKIAWDKIIAEPFNEWWTSTGKTWFADKASKMGEGIGSGVTMGLLALLGIDVSATAQEGKSVGGAFIKGFTEGFDTEKITEALKTWADRNKEIVVGLGVIIGGKLVAGIISGLGKLKDAKELFGVKGSKDAVPATAGMPTAYTTTTMAVSARIVNVYGATVRNVGDTLKRVATNASSAAGGAAIGAGGSALLLGKGARTAAAALPGAATLALPGATAAAETGAAINTVQLASGTYVASGGALMTGLANTGVLLGSGATTAGGAAVVGGASIAGIIGSILGFGSAGIDVYQGVKASKAGNSKAAKDEYVTAGTKAGMVGAGAAAGAGIGALFGGVGAAPGALIGAGIGGVASLFAGNKVGKSLSDGSDKGGWLSNFLESTKKTAANTWESVKTGASNAGTWISDKWNGFSDWFGISVWGPAKDIGISAINIAAGAWSEAKDWVADKWNDFSDWFDESVWTPVSDAAQAAGEWIVDRWGDARTWVGERWADFSGWFEESVWTPVKTGAQAAGTWVGERWSEAKTWVSETWGTVSGWFSETVWEPVKGAAQTAGAWLGDQFTAAKNAISDAWAGVSGWFDETVWGPLTRAAQTAGTWVGDKFMAAKSVVSEAWSGVAGWFETNVWGPIKRGATRAWNQASNKLNDLAQKGSKDTGLTTSKGKVSVLEHAWGGIMTKPHMGIVAEDGAEGIIPLSPSKRSRGLDLWQRTGELLGVQPYEDGGIVGDTSVAAPQGTASRSSEGINFTVNNKIEPSFTFEIRAGADPDEIVAVIKSRTQEFTDEIGDNLAERLARIFANMPVKGGAEA